MRPARLGLVAPAEAAAGATAPGAFASVEIHHDFDAVLRTWTAMMPHALATPYQTPSLLKAWADHAAGHEGVAPLIVVARDAGGRCVALLPLGVSRRFGVRIASFLGGAHSNYNVPLVAQDAVAAFDLPETLRLLREAAALGGVDMFELSGMPRAWEGVANPFAALPCQPSPDSGLSGPLAPSLEDHLKRFVSAKARSNQRRKMRRFEERGVPRIYRAENAAERSRLLDCYLVQKAAQFAERGVADPFQRPGVPEFLAEAAGLSGSAPVIDLYGFDLDDETIAVTGGIADAVRYCGMFISITPGEHSKYSPGEMLMNFVVEDSIRRGLKIFDLGVGAAGYKKMYCPNVEELFDATLGFTAKGRIAARAVAAKTAIKTRIKASPKAYRLVEKLRRLRAGRRPSRDAPHD